MFEKFHDLEAPSVDISTRLHANRTLHLCLIVTIRPIVQIHNLQKTQNSTVDKNHPQASCLPYCMQFGLSPQVSYVLHWHFEQAIGIVFNHNQENNHVIVDCIIQKSKIAMKG